jgi:inositol phosphorylceramide synthase catalytic subunit
VKLWRHMKELWPRWMWAPLLPILATLTFDAVRGTLRWDHLLLLAFCIFIMFWNETTKKIFIGLYPIAFVGVFYDTMKVVRNVGLTPERVHDCDLHALEARLFGWTSGGQPVTIQDWFQTHWWTPLDVLCAIPYGTFIWVSIAFGIYMYRKDYRTLLRYTWTFFAMNVIGFATYHIYPAAPPWYFHAHGCVVDLSSSAAEGPNLARVDGLLGFGYFHAMYGRSSDVFGAVPSLHVAYPLLIVLYGWRQFGAALRVASTAFSATMILAAAYLDHHWIIDEIVGAAYCVGVFYAARAIQARLSRTGSGEAPVVGRERALG